ncbi:uncharacterized protein LOC144114691 [Amblyomma americanum]
MSPPVQRLRPHTFFGHVPQGVCNVDICKELVTRFSKNELSGMQDFGGGRFKVTFRSKPAVQRFLSNPIIEVRGTAVRFAYRGTLSTIVRVFGFPVDIDVSELRGALEQYGPVENIALEYVPGFDSVPSGTRRARMEMKSALLNFLQGAESTVQCKYGGVARVCRRCGSRDHVRSTCLCARAAACSATPRASCPVPSAAATTLSRNARRAPSRLLRSVRWLPLLHRRFPSRQKITRILLPPPRLQSPARSRPARMSRCNTWTRRASLPPRRARRKRRRRDAQREPSLTGDDSAQSEDEASR